MSEREGVAGVSMGMEINILLCYSSDKYILCQIEYRDSIAHRRQQRIAIWCEDKIPSAIYGAQEIGKLLTCQRFRVISPPIKALTRKSVFMVSLCLKQNCRTVHALMHKINCGVEKSCRRKRRHTPALTFSG